MQNNFDTLLELINTYVTPNDRDAIHKTYKYALNAHDTQLRKSGEPYITHPVSVAIILAEQKMPTNVIMAGLLHDVVEDTNITKSEIEELFGEDVAKLVEGVTKLDAMPALDTEQMLAENQRKVIVATAKDVRVIIVKLADRLHNMQTITYMNEHKQKSIAKETIEIYAPIAHRLGMYKIKWELEDLSFKILNKNAYDDIAKKLNMKRSQREEIINNVIGEIEEYFAEDHIGSSIYGRTKHIYSIYQSMKKKNKTFEEINDLFGFRIVVDNVADCYRALGVIHNKYKPIPLCFKDYIPTPKHNLYQSIHTTVMTKQGFPIEFQIRTKQMEKVAQNGVAAHWMYKEGDETFSEVDKQLQNFQQMVSDLNEHKSDKFLKNLKDDFFSKSIIVYTPKGDVIELPVGSTVLDFAFSIHSKIAFSAVNAVVNDTTVSLFCPLKMGDIVNVITSDIAEPDVSYISKVKTHRAKEALKKYFKNVEKQDIRLVGSKMLVDLGHELNIKELIDKEDESYLLNIAVYFDIYDVESFLYNIGVGEIKISQIKVLVSEEDILNEDVGDVIIEEHIDAEHIYCRKCHPVPGDTIVACELSSQNKYIIHRDSCKYIQQNSLETYWTKKAIQSKYSIPLTLTFEDVPQALASILTDLSSDGINIRSLLVRSDIDMDAEADLMILIHNIEDLDKLKSRVRKNKYVKRFIRRDNDHN